MDLSIFVGPLVGGLLVGVASALMLLGLGRIAGISGIFAGALWPAGGSDDDRRIDLSFLAGLLAGGLVLLWAMPSAFPTEWPRSLPMMAAAGFLVGFGTRLGCGCTSGHGVCGVSRLAPRSIVATVTFVATGMITVTLVRVLGGAA
ncbi:MAG: YeeE/YedE family protein [Deltaproteobacteria bacterium]|nr:MAG: YeeE/YedE family protein [Deltaproteobacteria bacterium]